MEILDKHKELLIDKISIAQVGIIRKKTNKPHVSPVWFSTTEEDLTKGFIYFNSAKGRVKAKNLDKGSFVYFSIIDSENPYSYIGIDGIIDNIIYGNEADDHIDQLAMKYLKKEKYPFRTENEERIKYIVKINSLYSSS